jgi:acetoacetyl-CoA synthetase
LAPNLARFLAGFGGYEELHGWSLARPDEFWPAVWRFCGVRAARLWDRVLEPGAGGWFAGAELNFAATLLRPRDGEPALAAAGRVWTHKALAQDVARMAKALEAAGIGAADQVASSLPASPEAVIAFLAAASLGAVWVPLADGEAPDPRLRPKLLFAPDLPDPRPLASRLPTLRQVIVACFVERSPSLAGLPRALRWQDATAFFQGCHEPAPRALPFSHPLLLTGRPALAYPAGGLLLQFLKELVLHFDVKPASRIPLPDPGRTACWLRAVTALATGATLLPGSSGQWPEASLPASLELPNPLDPGGLPVPALGVYAVGGRIEPPCPSLPVDWP